MNNKKYPRIGQIIRRHPQGMCNICNAVLLNGRKPDTRIDIQIDAYRGNDLVFKAHRQCVDDLSNTKLLAALMAQD